MRKLFAALTLSIAFVASSGVAATINPPTCGDNCPWVQINPPTCGDNCPWVQINPPTCGDNCPWVK